jgi:hypothetical protein
MELKNHGWTLHEIEEMTVADLNDALLWIHNNRAKESSRLLASLQYHLLSQHKKGLLNATKISKKLTKTTPLNPKNRPTIIDTIKQWAELKGFK